ncbi:MAG: PIG-L family deacetylase [Patescibacteria group bacterium]|nr:PIG-L family deacetylase [Patescibacteria group bacterium]
MKIKIENKNILNIFAHPDDDAFGPGGTIIKLSKKNNIFEILLTNGQSGTNQITGKKDKNLGIIRKKESKNSVKILGIKKIFFLNYQDGQLSNNLYHEIAKKIEKIIKKFKIDIILTYEPRGVSGHIDHVFASMISSYLALKNNLEILYFCLEENQRKTIKDYFIYFPPGYKKNEIDLEFDISDFLEEKIKSIQCHKSQSKDGRLIINNLIKNKSYLKEFFIYKNFKKNY